MKLKKKVLEIKNSIKKVKTELASIENRADQMEERISDIKDSDLEMMQRKEDRDLGIKKVQEPY